MPASSEVTLSDARIPPAGGGESAPFDRLPLTLKPDGSLLTYYVLSSLLFGPAFVIALVPLYFRYHTMRYQVDNEGLTMRWGILFRREVSLTYARIQDIHLSSNFVERWLGLAKVQVQTASGSATAEMTIEGLPQAAQIRDFLYSRMRGARDMRLAAGHHHPTVPGDPMDEIAGVLREITAELRALREELPLARRTSDDA
jgi:putative membrane protein